MYTRGLVLNTALLVIGVHIGRMGCIPACGRNGNSLNVRCSQPSLHRQGAPLDRALVERLNSTFTSCSDTYGTQMIGLKYKLSEWFDLDVEQYANDNNNCLRHLCLIFFNDLGLHQFVHSPTRNNTT